MDEFRKELLVLADKAPRLREELADQAAAIAALDLKGRRRRDVSGAQVYLFGSSREDSHGLPHKEYLASRSPEERNGRKATIRCVQVVVDLMPSGPYRDILLGLMAHLDPDPSPAFPYDGERQFGPLQNRPNIGKKKVLEHWTVAQYIYFGVRNGEFTSVEEAKEGAIKKFGLGEDQIDAIWKKLRRKFRLNFGPLPRRRTRKGV